MPLLRIERWRQSSRVTCQPLGVWHQFQIMTFEVARGIWIQYQKNLIKLYNCYSDPIQLAGDICCISSRLCLHKPHFLPFTPDSNTNTHTTDKSKLEMKMTAIKMHNTIAGCFCRSSANWFHFYCRIVCVCVCVSVFHQFFGISVFFFSSFYFAHYISVFLHFSYKLPTCVKTRRKRANGRNSHISRRKKLSHMSLWAINTFSEISMNLSIGRRMENIRTFYFLDGRRPQWRRWNDAKTKQ